ncbi:MAG: nucleoside phosphorylase [Clostridiales bacterium]|nr:nucleoside phosphorylase [Clostridiales bacterium]
MSGLISNNPNEVQFHIKTKAGEVGRYVILPGDPGRVRQIAQYLDNAEFVAQNREYTTFTGFLLGKMVSVTSTGIGGPSAAIAVEELIKCGADTFIRVGTSGGISTDVIGGDLLIATAAVRGEGTSKEYLSEDYPAVANFNVMNALYQSAKALSTNEDGNRFHMGVVQSKDSFYGEINPENMPNSSFLKNRWENYVKANCLCSEMEAAALFSVSIARNVRAGAVLTALWNVERTNSGLPDKTCYDSTRAIKCAIDAIKLLIKEDYNC